MKMISVVVPVHNAERTLATCVVDLLDVLSDVAPDFEVLIVDDGSTDQTDEVAFGLAHQYPQVRVARHTVQQGMEASVETGVSQTAGDVVIVHAGPNPVNPDDLCRKWQRRDDENLVVARCDGHPGVVAPKVLRGLASWGRRLSSAADTPTRSPACRSDFHDPRMPKKPRIPVMMPWDSPASASETSSP